MSGSAPSSPQSHAGGDLLTEIRNGIAHVTLNRPKALNALTREMLAVLGECLAAWANDRHVHGVVVRGAGGKAFCAGGDIKALYEAGKADPAAPLPFFVTEYPVNHAISKFPKPYVALLDGITMGGGMGISQFAWVRVATERSRLAMPETGIGLIPDVGGSHFLSHLEGEYGTYIGLTGLTLNPSDALMVGLADCYIASDRVAEMDRVLDTLVWGGDPNAQLHTALRGVMDTPTVGSRLPALREAIDRHFAPSTVPAILASLDAEVDPDLREWTQSTAALLRKRSPTSLAVTLELLRRGRKMTLAECLRMEMDVVMNCFAFGNVIEGVRAVVVDKDQQPRWTPATLADVGSVERFFVREWPQGHPLAQLR